MKAFITTSLFIASFIGSSAAQTVDQKFSFEQKHISLGDVKKGEKKSDVFRFKNTGSAAIQIEFVSSCECTALEWTRGKIDVGQYGEIKFTFDSSQKEENEILDIDVYFKNLDPQRSESLFEILTYDYNLVY